MRRSSASAPMWRAFWRSTGSSRSRCWRCLRPGVAAAVLGFVTSFLVLRGSDLTRLMVTLGVALVLREIANRCEITGGADGLQGVVMEPVLGHFAFDIFGQHRLHLQPGRAVRPVPDRAPHRQLAVRPVAALRCKGNPLRAAAIGIHVNGRLVAVYTIAAGYAGIAGALLTQTHAVRLALGARLRALRRRDADRSSSAAPAISTAA